VVAGYGENVSFEGGFVLHLNSHFEVFSGVKMSRGKLQICRELYFEDCNLPVLMDNIDS
jgi:hypothetical protein